MFDYRGNFEEFKRRLEAAGVKYDITLLAGCTRLEIEKTVEGLIHAKEAGEDV